MGELTDNTLESRFWIFIFISEISLIQSELHSTQVGQAIILIHDFVGWNEEKGQQANNYITASATIVSSNLVPTSFSAEWENLEQLKWYWVSCSQNFGLGHKESNALRCRCTGR